MSVLVVDAGVAAKWIVEEEHDEAALALLDRRHQLHAPDFFLLEVDNIVLKWVRRGILTAADGEDTRAEIRSAPIEMHPFGALLELAYRIASDTGRSVHDGLYVALAVALGCQAVTADRRLYEATAAGALAEHVLWVEEVA
jgi:predicted nucleic acid-binding protein